MGIVYPEHIDSFSVPGLPEDTSLSSAGTSTRNHTESHQDLGLAVVAIEANAAQLGHDHSGGLASITVTESTLGSVPTNDIQTVVLTGTPTGGTWTLSYGGTPTANIAYNAVGSTVQTALQAVAGTNNVTVAGNAGGPYTCTFVAGLAHSPQAVMVGNSGGLTPSGGVNVSHSVTGSAGNSSVQLITIAGGPTGGTFTLSFGAYTTGALGYHALASDVQAALVALTSIGSSNVAVSGSAGGPYTVTFQGSLATEPQTLIVATSALTGGTFATQKLQQVNTHQNADTDNSVASVHHTLGYGATQAAAGNHAHDYEGSSIFNKPLVICTSTTRPLTPTLGMLVWETDTNCMRVWSAFPDNTYVGPAFGNPVVWSFLFNTSSGFSPQGTWIGGSFNSFSSLDPTVFHQTYVTGTSPADGAMASPGAEDCQWISGANVTCRCIARVIEPDFNVTSTDNQQLTVVTGKIQMSGVDKSGGIDTPSPTNDGYLRMSSDGQSYVRYAVSDAGVAIYSTTTGPSGEQFLGANVANTTKTMQRWTFAAVNNTYVAYQTDWDNQSQGPLVLSIVDYQNAVDVGPNNRGWGIGMSGAQGPHGFQLSPANVEGISISDLPFYNSADYQTNLIWQLLPVGAVPHVRAEGRFRQEVTVGDPGTVVSYDTLLWDWFIPFMNTEVSQTDITVQEAGHYSVHASICWDPHFFEGFDHAMVSVTVNGQDIGRKNWEFIRGNQFAPGVSQTNEINFTYHFAKNDVLRVTCRSNSPSPTWLWWWAGEPDAQVRYTEIDFIGP